MCLHAAGADTGLSSYHHLSHDGCAPSGTPFHCREASLFIELIDHLYGRHRFAPCLFPRRLHAHDHPISVLREGDLWLEQRLEDIAWHHLCGPRLDGGEVPQPQVIERPKVCQIARMPQRQVLQCPQLPLEGPGHRVRPPAGHERFERSDGFRELDRLELRHRLHLRDLPVPEEDGGLRVLVRQAGHVEREQVVERRPGFLGNPPVPHVDVDRLVEHLHGVDHQ